MYWRVLIYSSDCKHPDLYVGSGHTSTAHCDCIFLYTQWIFWAGRGTQQTIPTMSVSAYPTKWTNYNTNVHRMKK